MTRRFNWEGCHIASHGRATILPPSSHSSRKIYRSQWGRGGAISPTPSLNFPFFNNFRKFSLLFPPVLPRIAPFSQFNPHFRPFLSEKGGGCPFSSGNQEEFVPRSTKKEDFLLSLGWQPPNLALPTENGTPKPSKIIRDPIPSFPARKIGCFPPGGLWAKRFTDASAFRPISSPSEFLHPDESFRAPFWSGFPKTAFQKTHPNPQSLGKNPVRIGRDRDLSKSVAT